MALELLDLNEPAVHAVVGRLRERLGDVIAELNTGVEDGITIEPPTDEQILDFVPQLELLVDFPTIGIQDLPSKFEDDIGSSATGRHLLGVVIFHANPDQRELAWQLRRYARAVASCVLAGRVIEPDVWGVLLDKVEPGPTLSHEENPRTYMSWTAVTFDLRTEEGT
jgi:hypothetical protein